MKNYFKISKFLLTSFIILLISTIAYAYKYDIPDPPGQPQELYAGKTYCSICWDKPGNDGGMPITNYRVEYRYYGEEDWKSTEDVIGENLKCVVANLTEGREVSFRVFAINGVGTSSPSRPSEMILLGK